MRLPNFGSPNFSDRLVLSQVVTASVVTARVASVVTATIRGSAVVVVDVVVLRPRIRGSLGCSNLSLGLVGPCQLHILLQLVTSVFFPALFFMFILKNLGLSPYARKLEGHGTISL